MKKTTKNHLKASKPVSLSEKIKHCAHSRFCEAFGEYKCVKLERRIDAEVECLRCAYHRKSTDDKEDHVCHCEFCMSVKGENK